MRTWYRIAWSVTNCIFTVLFRRSIRGKEFIPRQGGFIIACNHISFWDPPLVGAAVGREVHFLAKEELFRLNRPFGWLIGSLNAVPIKRGLSDARGVRAALEVVSRGRGLVMFPEGTRYREGTLGPPLSGVGLLSVKAGVPIVPAYVRGSDAILRRIIRAGHIDLVFGEPYYPPARSAIGAGRRRECYGAVGAEVMRRIGRLKEQIDRET